jgi:hypothetical protein
MGYWNIRAITHSRVLDVDWLVVSYLEKVAIVLLGFHDRT